MKAFGTSPASFRNRKKHPSPKNTPTVCLNLEGTCLTTQYTITSAYNSIQTSAKKLIHSVPTFKQPRSIEQFTANCNIMQRVLHNQHHGECQLLDSIVIAEQIINRTFYRLADQAKNSTYIFNRQPHDFYVIRLKPEQQEEIRSLASQITHPDTGLRSAVNLFANGLGLGDICGFDSNPPYAFSYPSEKDGFPDVSENNAEARLYGQQHLLDTCEKHLQIVQQIFTIGQEALESQAHRF